MIKPPQAIEPSVDDGPYRSCAPSCDECRHERVVSPIAAALFTLCIGGRDLVLCERHLHELETVLVLETSSGCDRGWDVVQVAGSFVRIRIIREPARTP